MPIVDKLKEALKPGRKETGDEGDLNKLLASSAKKVLLQKIEFEPASKGFSYQLDSLKNKYVILNPRNEGASSQKAPEPAQIKRQGRKNAQCTGNVAHFDSFVVIFPYLPFHIRKCSSSFMRIISQNSLQFQKMWLAARVMGSPPRKRCSFRGTSLPSNGSGCTGWEPASITSGTPASSTPQCSVSPTPRRWPTTYSQRSTAVPVSRESSS